MRFNNDDDEVKGADQRFLNSMAVNWYDMDIRKLGPTNTPTKMLRSKWRLTRKMNKYSSFK